MPAQSTQLVYSDNPGSIPAEYVIPPNLDLELSSIVARVNGAAASGAFYACLSVYSQEGRLVGRFFPTQPLATGDSGIVTYAPFLGGAGGGSTTQPQVALDDYVFKHSNTTVTALGFNDASNVIIQGNALTLDGLTRIKIEFHCPCVEIINGSTNQACGFTLWDGSTNVGVIAYVDGNVDNRTSQLENCVYSASILTPAAGVHTYKICAWRNIAANAITVVGSTFIDGSGNFGPSWYRVTAT